MGGILGAGVTVCIIVIADPCAPRMLGKHRDFPKIRDKGISVGSYRKNLQRNVAFLIEVRPRQSHGITAILILVEIGSGNIAAAHTRVIPDILKGASRGDGKGEHQIGLRAERGRNLIAASWDVILLGLIFANGAHAPVLAVAGLPVAVFVAVVDLDCERGHIAGAIRDFELIAPLGGGQKVVSVVLGRELRLRCAVIDLLYRVVVRNGEADAAAVGFLILNSADSGILRINPFGF